jgi:hypothetical protein
MTEEHRINFAMPEVPVFKDCIEKELQLGVKENEVTGISSDDGFVLFVPEFSPDERPAPMPTTWSLA